MRYSESPAGRQWFGIPQNSRGELVNEIIPSQRLLPPVLLGSVNPENRARVEDFFFSVASIFEAWVNRRKSEHTRRAYRGDVMAFVRFMGWNWPGSSVELLSASILDVQAFKKRMVDEAAAPKTINRRISSLSSFFKFLAGAAAELRLPITVPNPAHAQFISREASDAVDETRALSLAKARQLMGMPKGDGILELRDRAILRFYLFTGARIATGCKLKVNDFQQDGDEATIRFHLKGGRLKTKGINYQAAEAIQEYITAADIKSGPLFRPRSGPKGERFADRQMTERTMNRLLMGYLERLPGSMQEVMRPTGEKVNECIYSPHSLRATTATLCLDDGVEITSVQDLLDHKHITTTQIYDKRRRSIRDSASHKVPI
jgi:integrase/recombinase XerC